MSGARTLGPMVIWRYEISIIEASSIILPESAKVVHAGFDERTPLQHLTLWILRIAEPKGEKRPRRFEVYGTGHTIPDDREHVGTVPAGPFVWHVLEALP